MMILRLAVLLFAMGVMFFIPDVKGIMTPAITYLQPVQLIEVPFVELLSAKGTRSEILELAAAVENLNIVYSSQCFAREIFTRDFTETDGMNNQEIYNRLRSGVKGIHVIYYTGSFFENHLFGVIGYVRDSIPDTVFQNRFFVKDRNDIARNLIHEIAHLWGFNHYQILPKTVPYQMNDIWDICAGELGIN